MRRRRDRSRSQSGFTLLELLVAIAILGLIVVALTGGLRFAGQAWELQQRKGLRQGDLDSVQNALRNLIAQSHDFRGDAFAVQFVGTPPAALARGGLYDMQLSASGDRLVLSWRPHFTGPATNLPQNQAVLAEGMTAFKLDYFIAPAGWRMAVAKGGKPGLVRIAAQFGDGRNWPPLLVAGG